MNGRELEVKLTVDSPERLAELGRLGRLGGCPLAARGVWVQDDSYRDTEDFALFREGLSLRRRRTGARTRWTLKEILESEGRQAVCDRAEQEEDVSGPEARPDPQGPIGRTVARVVGSRDLVAVAHLVTRRQKLDLLAGSRSVAEMCLDEVEVFAGDGSPVGCFFEVEVEDTGGGSDVLEVAGSELLGRGGLTVSTRSKFERALSLLGLLDRARSVRGDAS